jgi:hypothetical protein
MDHSICPRLCEYLFEVEVENALLTVPRAVGNSSGNPILLQLENTEEVKGSFSTYGKGFYGDYINT